MTHAARATRPWETATTQRALSDSLAQLSQAVPTVRRLAFLSTLPDVDTAAVCRLTAQAMARYRAGRILQTSQHPAARRADLRTPSLEQRARFPDDLRDGLHLDSDVWVADPGIDDRFFDVHCTDWGTHGPATGALEVAARAHAVCIVAPVDRVSAEPAVALAQAFAARTGGPAAVIAFTSARSGGSAIWARAVDPYLSVPSVVLDDDSERRFAAGRRLRHRSERALIHLAAHLLTGSLLSGTTYPATGNGPR